MIQASPLRKILLVEDNILLLRAMQAAFTRNGYLCTKAESAYEALDFLQNDIPDIILSDYMMPGMNGFEFRKALIQDPALRDIPFVFLTSFTDNEMVLQGLKLNALDYIDKETPISVIVSKLKNLLDSLNNQHEKSINELRQAAEALNVKSFPGKAPELSDFKLDFWHKGFQGYPGGDFIDIIKVDERYCFVVLGDVMGKKWKAWYFTFGFLSYIRAAIRFCISVNTLDLAEIIQQINKLTCQDETLQNILCSMSLLLIDNQRNLVFYSGAGDLPLVLYQSETGLTKTITSSGLLIGFMDDGFYDEQIIEMKKGDQLVLFTDGLIDVISTGKKKSDYPLFVKNIEQYLGLTNSFSDIQKYILEKITRDDQLDDASIVFIEKITQHDTSNTEN